MTQSATTRSQQSAVRDLTRRGGSERLALLYEVTAAFNERIDLDELLPLIITKSRELLDAESSALLLLDAERHELYFPYIADVAPDVEQRMAQIRFPADRGIAGWVLQHGTPQLVPDVARDPRWYGGVDQQSGMSTQSLLCAPLRTAHGVVGVIELRNKLHAAFSELDLAFLTALAGGIAIAIDNARLYRKLKESEAKLRQQVVVLQREVAGHSRFTDLVGSGEAMARVFELMEHAVTAPVSVLIEGETGTGKELIARAIHFNGPRRDGPFVPVNCGAISETLLESELFGHKRGAFTGASSDRKGVFEVANGGTILLDEVGETTPAMQIKLLRVLQNGEVVPVGDTQARFVDVRVISATNCRLEVAVEQGRFREDLYYRLNAFPIAVPPLRARKEDIPLLAAHLLERTTEKFGRRALGWSPTALAQLSSYDWPGNVRELANEIERAVAVAGSGETIEPRHLSDKLNVGEIVLSSVGTGTLTLQRAREGFEARYIAEALQQHHGNVSHTARALGLSRSTLHKLLKRYRLQEA
ncbi:MAG: sigma 54-interacting transcriptional regulator [Deltaproteobacteria bacterium]|nr:sigma 54-interacting transcriptional regulator [Deltaproteobacteria bacterium]